MTDRGMLRLFPKKQCQITRDSTATIAQIIPLASRSLFRIYQTQ